MPKPWNQRKAAQQTRADRKRAVERGETFTTPRKTNQSYQFN